MFPTKPKGKPMKLVAGVESVLWGILHTQGRSTASTAGLTEITNYNKKTQHPLIVGSRNGDQQDTGCISEAATSQESLWHCHVHFCCSEHLTLGEGTH